MLALFADESYDDYTYVLGGWLITPTHWKILGERWQKMLDMLKLADGSPCPGFHAYEIMSQSGIYKGWGKDEAFDAFNRATAVLAEQPGRFAASPCAVATQSNRSSQHLSFWIEWEELPARRLLSHDVDPD